jgi:hypothetical protein
MRRSKIAIDPKFLSPSDHGCNPNRMKGTPCTIPGYALC